MKTKTVHMTRPRLHAALAAAKGGLFFLLLCGSFTNARGQAISNPNQIVGKLSWNNPPGPVATFLATHNGLTYGTIYASSVPPRVQR